MYRLAGMTSGSTTVVNGVSYNAANELLGMTFNGIGETRSYNVLNQLTNVHAGSGLNLTYNYPTGTDNGKISSMYNAVSGETVTYSYDSLNRIATAGGSGWGEAYTFDGFGNLTTKHVTSGAGPSLSVPVDPNHNQIEGLGGYDANGNTFTANAAYDVENHIYALVGESPYTSYAYDGQGKRVFTYTSGSVDTYGNPINYLVVLYSVSGQKMGTYQISTCDTSMLCSLLKSSDQYFGGRRLAAMDQLGSVGTYYPWGEAKGTTNPQDTWSYATYWRDSVTGLDYANNRYYSNAYGRFMTPDPYQASGGPSDPQSWNRYAYTGGDPVNKNDPTGRFACDPDDPSCDPTCDYADPGCDPGCDPFEPSCAPGQPQGSGPKGPTLPAPTPVSCNSAVTGLAGALGGTATCDVGFGPAAELFTSLSDFNSFLEGMGLPPLAGTGGIVIIDGVSIGWAEIGAGIGAGIGATIGSPVAITVVVSIGAIAGAVALYNYWEKNHQPCVPPPGTKCYEPQSGHTHNNWDPHYHLWEQNQNPSTGQCFWRKIHGTRGTTPAPPAGMLDCNTYPSWPSN